MARINWLDPETDLPALDEHVARLEHFTDSMADGVIDAGELEKQEHAVVAAMKAVPAPTMRRGQDSLMRAVGEAVSSGTSSHMAR